MPIGAQEGGNSDEGMGQGRVGEEIARDIGEALKGRESSPVIWEGPPTDKDERSGKVKDTAGSFLGEKKG